MIYYFINLFPITTKDLQRRKKNSNHFYLFNFNRKNPPTPFVKQTNKKEKVTREKQVNSFYCVKPLKTSVAALKRPTLREKKVHLVIIYKNFASLERQTCFI